MYYECNQKYKNTFYLIFFKTIKCKYLYDSDYNILNVSIVILIKINIKIF